jgi:hypothetical protein
MANTEPSSGVNNNLSQYTVVTAIFSFEIFHLATAVAM